MSKFHDVEIIIVGNELLRGDRRDEHLGFLGLRLLDLGIRLDAAHVVEDDREEIAQMVADRRRRTRVIIITGGLGPTHDDVTRDGVADGLGVGLVFDEGQWTRIQEYFGRFGRSVSESNRRQAFFPEGTTPLDNSRGTAPGFIIDKDNCLIAVLPGPPREFQTMMEKSVVSELERVFSRPALYSEVYRTAGIGESAMAVFLDTLMARFEEFTLASLPHVAGVDLLVRAKPDTGSPETLAGRARELEKALLAELGNKVYTKGSARLEEVVGDLLVSRGETIAIAESVTGGLLGKTLTDIPGSSRYVLSGVVAYSNDAKIDFLGVRESSLMENGAVSEIVCREMADGIRVRTGAAFGLATTGIAGPTGATEDKPVGLCYYGLSWDGGSDICHRVFSGEREDVRERVVWASLFQLFERLS
jgi:nicotinamide-nucleotide amidase